MLLRTKSKLFTILLMVSSVSCERISSEIEMNDQAELNEALVKTSVEEASDADVRDAAIAARPTFADMVSINTPIVTVEGDYSPLGVDVTEDVDLSQRLTSLAKETESYGVIVWHKGNIIFEIYPEPHSSDTRGESASMHKSVMALLVGAAIDDGYIGSVEDKIGRYIPDWKDDSRGAIKIRNLLAMNSGLQPLSTEGGMDSPAVNFMMKGETARSVVLNSKISDPPAEIFHYQNTTSQTLGLILEAATGQPYQDYLSSRLWQPVGASDAKVWLNEAEGFPKTYTGLYAIPRDWLRIGLLVKDFGVFDGKQIISRDYIQHMTSASVTNPNYGWQIWRGENHVPRRYYNEAKTGYSVKATEPFAVDDIIYFDGFGGQRVYISRSKDLVVVRLGNARMDWDDSLLPNLVLSTLD